MPKPKTLELSAADLSPAPKRPAAMSMRTRGEKPERVPMQFKFDADQAQAIKRAALDHRMRLNEFILHIFEDYQRRNGGGGNAG